MAQENVVLHNGEKMPMIGLGTWRFPYEVIEKAINTALETGYRHIDTAYMYRNETEIGKVLKQWFDSGEIKREDLFIVTKLPPIGNRAECVEKYLKHSLAALQLDYVDLYLIHCPVGMLEKDEDFRSRDEKGNLLLDMNTDLISLWKGMEAQVDAGRAKSIGLSNFCARQIKKIVSHARIRPANLQVELNIYFQQRELAAFCKALDITLCAYSPLGSPDLEQVLKKSGRDDTSNLKFHAPLKDPVVLRIAKKHNKTPGQILLKHTMQRGIVVIPRSTNPSRIKENFQVFDFELTQEDVDELDTLDKGRKGRVFDEAVFAGMEKHPEYSFNDPY